MVGQRRLDASQPRLFAYELNRRNLLRAGAAGAAAAGATAFLPRPWGELATAQALTAVTIGMTQDTTFPDPARNVALNDLSTLWINIYDTLIMRQPDGTLGPWLAESWESPSDTEWVFTLRPGVTFHNGEPLDAEAVKFTYERYLEADKPRYGAIASVVDHAEVIDPTTVKLVTKKPNGLFLELMWEMPIVPPHYIGEVGDEGFEAHPIGSGAYKFVQWSKGDRLELERNPDYWNGSPVIERAVFRYMPEVATRLAALQAGEIDIAMQLPPDAIAQVEDQSDLRVSAADSPRMIFFVFFPESPLGSGEPLNDVRVRKAINHAVDVDSIIATLLAGQATRIAVLYAPQTYGFDPSIEPLAYDPELAKSLLAEAGYAEGFTLDVDVPTGGNPIKPVEVGQAVAANLAEVGINVQMRTVDAATYTTMRNERNVAPMFMWNWLGFDGDYVLWANLHSSSQIQFMTGWDEEIDALIEQEQTSLDQEERAEVFKQLQARLAQDVPHLPLYQQKDIFGVNRRIAWDAVTGGYVILRTITPA
jgi:peptide/nickel transport system substrate-binding protein